MCWLRDRPLSCSRTYRFAEVRSVRPRLVSLWYKFVGGRGCFLRYRTQITVLNVVCAVVDVVGGIRTVDCSTKWADTRQKCYEHKNRRGCYATNRGRVTRDLVIGIESASWQVVFGDWSLRSGDSQS